MFKTLRVMSGTLVVSVVLFLAGLQALALLRDFSSETVPPADTRINSKSNSGVVKGLDLINGRGLFPLGFGLAHAAEPEKSGALRAGSYGDASHIPQITIDASGRITGYVHQPMVVQDKGGQVYNVLAYGADPTGAKDSTTAFQKCYDAIPLGGGIMFVPQGHYKVKGGALAFGEKPLFMQGVGSRTRFGGYFGSPGWQDISKITGSILHVHGEGDGLTLGVANNQSEGNRVCTGVRLQGIALVGPGTGASSGIHFNPTSGSDVCWDDIAIFNFSTGFKTSLLYETAFHRTTIWACETGILLSGDTATISFFSPNIRINGTGLLATNGQGIHFYGGVFEGNTKYGVNIAPPLGNPQDISFYGTWFEQNQKGAIHLDATKASISGFRLYGCHFSSTKDTITFAGSEKIINGIMMAGNGCPEIGMTLPENILNSCFLGNNFGKGLTDKGSHNVIIEPENAGIKFGRVSLFDAANTKLGFFGAKPIPQQKMGEAKAGKKFGANEQQMLQKVYNALRAYGLGD